MSTAAIFFVDVILTDFDHAGSEQFAEMIILSSKSDVTRLLIFIFSDCSCGGIDRVQ